MPEYSLAHVMALAGGTVHAAPSEPLSVRQAHQAMQHHIECAAAHCPAKFAAWQTLIESGRIQPDYERSL